MNLKLVTAQQLNHYKTEVLSNNLVQVLRNNWSKRYTQCKDEFLEHFLTIFMTRFSD